MWLLLNQYRHHWSIINCLQEYNQYPLLFSNHFYLMDQHHKYQLNFYKYSYQNKNWWQQLIMNHNIQIDHLLMYLYDKKQYHSQLEIHSNTYYFFYIMDQTLVLKNLCLLLSQKLLYYPIYLKQNHIFHLYIH